MMNRGFFSRGPCSSPVNCGFGLNSRSRSRVYSGTGGRGRITRGDALFSEVPVAASSDSLQFTQYDNSPIEQKEESQYHPVITGNEHVESPQSFEISGAEVGRTFQETEVNQSNWIESQISQQMNSQVTTGQEYNNTFPEANSSYGQTHNTYTAEKIYPVMTKSQEYQDTYPKTMPASSWNVSSPPNGMNETDLYINTSPVQEMHVTSNAASMEPRGFSVDKIFATQDSQLFDFQDLSVNSFDASITEPISSQNPEYPSWNTGVASRSLNDQWTSQQEYQEPSHMANTFTNLPVTTNSSFNQGQSFGFSGNQNLATGIDMDEDARILAQKAGG